MEEVLASPDLMAHVLQFVGPSGHAAATRVCTLWHSVCRTDPDVLRAVAAYQGSLTKTDLMCMFALSPQEADRLPRTVHRRVRGGSFHLYGAEAVDALVTANGLIAWHARLKHRAERAGALRRRGRVHGSDVLGAIQKREEARHWRSRKPFAGSHHVQARGPNGRELPSIRVAIQI